MPKAAPSFARRVVDRVAAIEEEHRAATAEVYEARLAVSKLAASPDADPEDVGAANERLERAEAALRPDPAAPHTDSILRALYEILVEEA
jgi:hypothetical protein